MSELSIVNKPTWHLFICLHIVQIRAGREVTGRRIAATRATFVGAAPAKNLANDVGKRILEVPIGHDINHRVQGRVEVANPEQDRHHCKKT